MPTDEKLNISDLCLLELRFRVIAPVRKLPHYHGAQWSALFRHTIKPYLPVGTSMAAAGISCIPVETGIESYETGEPVHVGLNFPATILKNICSMLANFNELKLGEGHFNPGRTVMLEKVYNRITDKLYNLNDLASLSAEEASRVSPALTHDSLTSEIYQLAQMHQFSIIFYTPMRLNRPGGYKAPKHVFCDEDYFTAASDEGSGPMDHIVRSIRNVRTNIDANEIVTNLMVTDNSLIWLDIPYYGNRDKPEHRKSINETTLGGIVGSIKITGTPAKNVARRLVIGQYTGVGKNHVFGLGYYSIPELDDVRKVKHLTRGKSLLQRALTVSSLKKTLEKTTVTSPGPDGLYFSDIKKAGHNYLGNLGITVINGTYQAGGFKSYRMPKSDGGFREIHIQNAIDRLLQKAVADCITPVIDNLLSKSSFAYRLGLNRKGAASALKRYLGEGFTTGIKADIAAFFDSVQLERLADLLHGLFHCDDFPDTVIPWLLAANAAGASCLPQGSPLSPVLSNLYLHRFDRDMAREDFKLIRYADDFVCLFQSGLSADKDMEKIKESLARLGLALKQEKTTEIRPGSPVDFLGYNITATDITEERQEAIREDEQWLPVFRETWLCGTPVYLSSICRGAYSSGPDLVIKDEQQGTQTVPWSRISRLIVVGRSPFSGGVVYRAARENIPISFVDVKGHLVGSLNPSGYEVPEMAAQQEVCSKDPSFCLAFAREIISAKIMNSHVLLRRNKVDISSLKEVIPHVLQADNMDTLRGYEGYAAKLFFGAFASLVMPFEFKGRIYHPPDGPVNVMLSFGYTLLYNRIALVLKDKGFNPRVGFFHQGRGGHLSLASDLLEELRHIVDRIVLALIHNREIKEYDFATVEKKGLSYSRLEGEGFRKYIHRFEHTMATTFTVENGENFTYNTYLDEMVDHLKRSLRMSIPYRALRID